MTETLIHNRLTNELTRSLLNPTRLAKKLGYTTEPAVLEGDHCVKLLLDGQWVATAQQVRA